MVDHADFLGLRQGWAHLRGRDYREPEFKERWLYRWCRHPMMLGLLITFWVTPRMTVGHLFFAAAGSAYIAVGIRFEERDLRTRFGADYQAYAKRVPSLVPGRKAERDPLRSAGPVG
jgi:protein-S-isoprenylcysteine O-methyltransferase Ste14